MLTQFSIRLIFCAGLQLTTLLASDNAQDAALYANATLSVTNNDWVMAVAYDSAWKAPFVAGAVVATILISLVISSMLMEVLVERQAHKNLIKEMLPKKAMRKIQRGEVVAESYNIATIFFSDIVGYTTMSAEMRPIKVMKLLNSFYTEVDKIAEKHGVYKIETIGDAYMCVGGCPDRCLGPEGAEKVALFALDMIELVKNFRTEDGSKIVVRAGVNSGPVVAGVVGTTRPQFTLFGDAVDAASRIESTSKEMKIQCSDFTYRLLRDAPNFNFIMKERGHVQIKGKGNMNTWWIEGVTDALIQNDSFSGASTNPFLRGGSHNNERVMEKSPEGDSTVSGDSDDQKKKLEVEDAMADHV
jgi:class 3 adenylate cyclase